MDVAGNKTNIAQVSAADQPDIDSTPGNNNPDEDDQDSVTIEAPQIDLSLTKTVDNATPDVGEDITFTITVSNAGPNDATGVRVRDLIPSGLPFVCSSTVSGTYNAGDWYLERRLDSGCRQRDPDDHRHPDVDADDHQHGRGDRSRSTRCRFDTGQQ